MIDCGKGIPEEERQLIFNPIIQNNFKDNKNSLGLGALFSTTHLETTQQ